MIKNIFEEQVCNEIIQRINTLTTKSERLWGSMSVDQMLAHCNMPYAYTFMPEQFKKPNVFVKFLLKNFVKKMVVSPNPYKQNERTSHSMDKNKPFLCFFFYLFMLQISECLHKQYHD